MNPEGLLASAVINIGLAFIILSLFSIFKKQPSNASIYYARRLSKQEHITFDLSFTLSRFLPSISWITHALRVTEDEIVDTGGLDALIIIRLFKFCIKFFVACSLVGLLALLPVNYFTGHHGPWQSNHSMDAFTISNIGKSSNWLWVHFTSLWFISLYGLYLLHREYNEILIRRLQQQRNNRHRPDQFSVLVRQIPDCTEHRALGCSVDHFFSKHHSYTYHSYQILYKGKDLEDLVSQAKSIARKIEELRDRPALKKHNRESLLLDASREDVVKITLYEDKLQELCHKIHQLQSKDMLKDKDMHLNSLLVYPVALVCSAMLIGISFNPKYVQLQELPVAFITFKSRWGAALAAQSQQHSHPLQWITERAPEPRDVYWRNLAIPYKILPLYRIGVIVAATIVTIFFIIPVTAVQGIAKYEKLKKWFPPAMAVQLIPGLRSIVMGYLPSVVLNGFIYIVPFAMICIANAGGSISKSKAEIKTCNMVFYFLVGNVFFLSLISGSLLDEIGESFAHPRNFPSRLARAVSAQADFFTTYILADGLSGFSLEILQAGLLSWNFIKSHTCGLGKEKNPFLYRLPYFRVIPFVCLLVLIGMVYAVISPLLLPFLVGYFFLGYVVYINQIQDVYETAYDTCGQFWPYIHHFIFVGLILMQITMIGLFGLKSKPAASIATIPLLFLTLLFNEYCKARFLPTFLHYSIQNTMDNDELDEKSGDLEVNYRRASNAYHQPFLQPLKPTVVQSSLRQPLVSSV